MADGQITLPHAPGRPRAKLQKCSNEGTNFAMLQHMMSNPLHLIVMAAVMLAQMAIAMIMVR